VEKKQRAEAFGGGRQQIAIHWTRLIVLPRLFGGDEPYLKLPLLLLREASMQSLNSTKRSIRDFLGKMEFRGFA